MTHIEEALLTFIQGGSSVQAIFSTRFYPLVTPLQPVYPCVAYQRIDGVEVESHQGASNLIFGRYQLTGFDTSYARLATGMGYIRDRLQSYNKNKALLNGELSGLRVDSIRIQEVDNSFEPSTREYRRAIDVFIDYAA